MRYRIGIVGCGRIAVEFEDDPAREHPCTHIGAYSQLSSAIVACAAETDPIKLEYISRRWKIPHLYKDYREMLRKEELDVISVCTPLELHKQVVVDAAKSRVKAIFCEKPMAVSLAEAAEMVKACRDYGVYLTINHSRRWDANYGEIRKTLGNGVLGDVVKIVGGYTSGLMAMGTHLIDLMHQFFGDVEWVIGLKEDAAGISSLWYSENYHPEDPPVSGIMGFKTGITGQLYATCQTDYPFFKLEIFTREGRINIVDWVTSYLIEIHRLKSNGNKKELCLQSGITSRANNLMMSAVQDIITSLEQGKATLSPGEEGLRVMRTIDGLRASCRKQSKVIKLAGDE